MAIIQDWKIRSTEAKCVVSGEPFKDGEDFYTCIFDDPESDGFIRRDYSVGAWQEVRPSLDPKPFSFWRSTYKAPVKVEEEKKIEDTSAEGMLRRFIEEDDSRTENARYILALMLERKKVLIPTDSKETETRKLLFYEHEENGDVFIVADPGLKLAEIEVVQTEVSELLAEEEAKAKASKAVTESTEPVDEHGEGEEGSAEESSDGPAETE